MLDPSLPRWAMASSVAWPAVGVPRRIVVGALGAMGVFAAALSGAMPVGIAVASTPSPYLLVTAPSRSTPVPSAVGLTIAEIGTTSGPRTNRPPARRVVPPDTSGDENGVAPSELPTLSPPRDDTVTTDPGVPQRPPVLDEPRDRSAPLVVVPAGCPAPDLPAAVFVGDLVKRDFRTAQFTIRSVRAGSLAAWSVGDQVQVRYGDDVRFLEVGDTYIVGTQSDPATGLLTSKVREPAPLFGGDAVLGVDDKDVTCPALEDPVMTLAAAATPIDSGLLTPLRHAKGDVLLAVLRPFVVALVVLLALVMAKQLLFAGGRSLRAATVTERPRPSRTKVRRARVLRTSRRQRPTRGDAVTTAPAGPGPVEARTAERVIVVDGPAGGLGHPEPEARR